MSGSHVEKKAPRTDRNWSPCWHDAENSHFWRTPGELMTDGEPHATAQSRGSRSRTLGTVQCATRCQDAATAGTARSNRCCDSNASRKRGGRRLCWWRRWQALNEHCRSPRNGQCRWARAGISAWSRNQSRGPFACNENSLKVSNLIEAISWAAGNVQRHVGREADPSSPGVSRPVIRLLWSLLAPGPPPPPIIRRAASRQAWRGGCLSRFHEAGISPTQGHARGPVPVSVWCASWAALRGAVWQSRPFGEPQMHLPGRSRAHLPLGRARSTLRPPIHARARMAAAWDAIHGSLGRPLGRHRPHGVAPSGLRSRARAPRALVSRVACCRPPATAYEHAVRRRPVLARSFIPPRSRTHPPTVEFFPPLPPAWDAGGCAPPPPPPPPTVHPLPPPRGAAGRTGGRGCEGGGGGGGPAAGVPRWRQGREELNGRGMRAGSRWDE